MCETKHLDDDLHFFLQEQKMTLMAWSPLGHGRMFNASKFAQLHNELKQIAWEMGTDVDTLALAWIMALPIDVMPIVGTSRIEGIKAAVKAESISLSHEQWYRLLQAAKMKSVI